MKLFFVFIFSILNYCMGRTKLNAVFLWNQLTYDLDGIVYKQDADYKISPHALHFEQDLEDYEKFFIQYNNVPVGFEVFGKRVIVTVPRRRYGIPSTLNFVEISSSKRSPPLKRYPGSENLISVYRPRIDPCERLWMVDTGLLEIPGNRTQVKQPAIVVYDLKTDKQILYYELKDTDLVDERSSGGLTSITVDVTKDKCDDAHAYINDLATAGIVVFSLKKKDSWRVSHPTFVHDEKSLNFTISDYVINWKDNLFSIALSEPDDNGDRKAFYHPLVSTEEFSVNTNYLKSGKNSLNTDEFKLLGSKGPKTQSGTHDYHPKTKTLFFSNVAQDAILCWRVDNKMAPENIGLAIQDHRRLLYISDLKVIGDDVWALINKMPIFIYSKFNLKQKNFLLLRLSIKDLIKDTPCARKI